MKIILGSASKKRKILLEEAGIIIDGIITADIDEKAIRHESPIELVQVLARAKREALRQRVTEPVLLITADTVLFCGDELFEKPESPDEERKFFKSYDGKTEFGFATGITVTNTATGETREAVDAGSCVMGPFSEEFIEEYIKKGEYKEYAGGFTYMDPAFSSLKFISGHADSLMGISVELVKKFLKELDI